MSRDLEQCCWWHSCFWDMLQQLHKNVACIQFCTVELRLISALFLVSSFQLRSYHTHGRNIFNGYMGNEGYTFVKLGNLFCSRLALLIILCFAKGIRWIVEQPEGSALPHHPRFQEILKIGKVLWFEKDLP